MAARLARPCSSIANLTCSAHSIELDYYIATLPYYCTMHNNLAI